MITKKHLPLLLPLVLLLVLISVIVIMNPNNDSIADSSTTSGSSSHQRRTRRQPQQQQQQRVVSYTPYDENHGPYEIIIGELCFICVKVCFVSLFVLFCNVDIAEVERFNGHTQILFLPFNGSGKLNSFSCSLTSFYASREKLQYAHKMVKQLMAMVQNVLNQHPKKMVFWDLYLAKKLIRYLYGMKMHPVVKMVVTVIYIMHPMVLLLHFNQ